MLTRYTYMNLNLQNIFTSTFSGLVSVFIPQAKQPSVQQDYPYLFCGSNVVSAEGMDLNNLEVIEEGQLLIVQGTQLKNNQVLRLRKVYQFRNAQQFIKSIDISGNELIITTS
ncbi:MAG TPA: hypothetical protein PKD18_13570 [Saprospiraceae bacterium]|nr:hypothetical protein [Saprospiraceae bacterium]